MTPIDKAEAHDNDLIQRGDAEKAMLPYVHNVIADDAISAIAALPAVAPQVKALVWEEQAGKSYRQANCALGQYQVSWLVEFECWQLSRPPKQGRQWKDGFSRHSHKDEAKAAAQADYEARILAALDLTPAQSDDAVKAREAAIREAAEACAALAASGVSHYGPEPYRICEKHILALLTKEPRT